MGNCISSGKVKNLSNNRDNTRVSPTVSTKTHKQDNESKMTEDSPIKTPLKRGRRQAVAAESYDPTADDNSEITVVFNPKTEEQLSCLQDAASNIIFFKKCDKEQRKILFNAMFEKKVEQGDIIIRQGDDGDNFYVIESGEYDVVVKDANGQEKKVATLSNGFFGELALLYNCPRNATIVASTEGVCWGLDQRTFREVVVKATARKRAVFEELLKSVSMLDSLTPYELMNLTDALDECEYKKDEQIIREGDSANEMYFIMDGQVIVRVEDAGSNNEKDIVTLGRGKYFGELALVLQKPRVASVYALSDKTKCAILDIHAFERLLGPCIDIMKRNFEKYENERMKLGITSIADKHKNGSIKKNDKKIEES